ncbi:MAG: hypothetical protein SVV03_00875 [Candidatus Nanohaloarchaea archaeon]|nr:hypothetical protein [Candidatus Nanohaloarchaea archaeon]
MPAGKDKCAQCGTDLADIDEPVKQGGKNFCSQKHADKFDKQHGEGDHNKEDDREVCEFC